MTFGFANIPPAVIDFIRATFAAANDKVSRTLDVHPSMHEESLDHILIQELSAAPPVFFANEQVGVAIESHWLGGRWMWHRWEIADIALFIILRRRGHLQVRKVALLQTKRLYSREITVATMDEAEYRIGIGRIADRTDPLRPISTQRQFTFDGSSLYGAIRAGEHQIEAIEEYFDARGIPIYYGFYNPTTLPFSSMYPASAGAAPATTNIVGCRILPSDAVHAVVAKLAANQSPTFDSLSVGQPHADDPHSNHGWRLEHFVADEVLRCREGRLFEDADDENLRRLLYARSAPIQAAITITVDINNTDSDG